MMQIINQKTDFDCALAALAMFFEEEYDSIHNKFMPKYMQDRAVSNPEEVAVFKGMKARHVSFPTWTGPLEEMKAICSAPSLNTPGMLHALYFDGVGFRDPQNGREGKKFYAYDSRPVICCLTLDLNCRRSIRMATNTIWETSYWIGEALKEGE